MSVLVQKGKAPEGAIKISKDEAINLQWKFIHEWKPSSDVWPFRQGMVSIAIGTAISAFIVVSHFRRKLKLKEIGQLAMYLPNVILPTLTLPLLHRKFVSEPILLQSECPVCIQMRSIFIQNCLGLGYPLVIAPLAGFMLASSFATMRLPLLTLGNIPSLFNVYRGMLQPFATKLLGLSLFHTVLAVTVTEAEARSFFKIQRKLLEQEHAQTV